MPRSTVSCSQPVSHFSEGVDVLSVSNSSGPSLRVWVQVRTKPLKNWRSWLLIHLVSATGPGNPPAVRILTRKTVQFGSRPIQKPDPQLLGGPNPDPYPWTRGCCQVWLVLSVIHKPRDALWDWHPGIHGHTYADRHSRPRRYSIRHR